MSRRYITSSDLTGKEIKEGEGAELRVLSHPLLEQAVKLDAQALEVASLKGTTRQLVEIELVLPATPPEKLLLDLDVFDKLFKQGNVDDILGSAERYYPGRSEATEPRRRGRPKGSTNTVEKPTGSGMSKEQLQAVREWANANGHAVSARGRIAAPIIAAFEEAHKS